MIRSFNPEFNGWQYVNLGLAVLIFCTAVLLLLIFIKSVKRDFYSFKTIARLAFSLLFFVIGISQLITATDCIVNGSTIYAEAAMLSICFENFVLFTMPFFIAFSAAMIISNIVLIKREGFKKNNLFAIAVSVFLLMGDAFGYYIYFFGFFWGIRNIISSLYSALFAYFECVMISVFICAQIAGRKKLSYVPDGIIILGCYVRPDGTLPPITASRVDRAIDVYNSADRDKFVFVPSGGKGSDETLSEGEAMRNHLLMRGIDGSIIYPETNSVDTVENMKFSKQLIESGNLCSRPCFSTSTFHVMRSGIIASRAGLKIEGVGAKTKWYYWPNAMFHDFIGILWFTKKRQAVALGILTVAAVMLPMILL